MAATASLSAVAAPLSVAGLRKPLGASSFRPLQPRAARMTTVVRASASSSVKEKAAAGLTAAALAAALVVPDVAEAAQSLTPSLKNFLLSIVSGGVVLVAIVGAVVAVSNFDPVKRA
ncbi:unnamed protein product [Miscanthus lutarioriparius]|uniref:Ultraviolet-B-repressible protein n=1 Tax=Miscanthus lutarioriparius TaxID=422564 RepID=A0A811MVN0_9POAL|nr:unnamed protein product [Miscanthus lutarioriparius]